MKINNVIIAVTASVVVFGCSQNEDAPTETQLRPVRIAIVANNGTVRERTLSGTSQSTQESRLSFKVNGTVVELPVQAGDQLKKGSLIASLNRSSYVLQVQQAEASLTQAQASQRNADANYTRVKGLYENNNASRNDLDSARANAESAEAQVRSAAKSLEIARLNLSYTQLTAANDCTIASVDVDLNENVNAGTQVAKVNCGTGIEVSLGVPESLISQISQGMSATIRFNALSGRDFMGEVTEVGVSSGSNASTFPVVVTLKQPDQAVRPGMAADITFAFESAQKNTQVIPASAVVNDERGTFVYIASPLGDGSAKIRRQTVEIGELIGNGIEIMSGLAEGDIVVTAGTSVIREQQIVLLPQG